MSSLQPRNEELLSAYIDGELSETERAEVEAWLAEDPQARALVDELQGLSSAVKSLPPEKLPRDLAPAVLDELARHSPSRDAAANSIPPANPSLLSRRGIWWSAAAIAAALLIGFLGPHQLNQPQEGAIAKRGEETADAATSSPRARSGEAPQLTAPDNFEDAATADNLFVRSGGRGGVEAPEAEAPTDDAAPPPMPAPATDMVRRGPAQGEGQGGGASPDIKAPMTTAAAPTGNRLADSGDYLVVWVDVPADALEQRAIDRLFLRNDIRVESQIDQWSAADEPVREHLAKRVADPGAFGAGGAPSGEADDRDAITRNDASSRSFAGTSGADGGATLSEAILVEATFDQLTQCLADMQDDTQNFREIMVEAVVDTPSTTAGKLWQRGQGGEPEALHQEASEVPPPPAPAGDNSSTTADRPPSDPRPEDTPALEPSRQTAEPAPSAPAPASEDKPSGETPPRESAPATTTQETSRFNYAQREAPEEETHVGRARRLPPIATSPQEPTGPNTLNLTMGDQGEERAPQGEDRQQQPTDSVARTRRLLELRLTQNRAQGTSSDRPLQILFVLRSQPPEIAAEASPALAPAAAPGDE